MTPPDRARFAGLLTMLAETFQEPMTDVRLDGYWLALEPLTIAAVEAAVRSALSTAKFFPRPAELLALAGAGEPDAGLVEALIVRHLSRRVPLDPFLRLVIDRLGGRRAVEDMPAGVRLGLVGKILPGVITAARATGIALPGPTADLPAICHLEADAPALEDQYERVDPRDRTVPAVVTSIVERLQERRGA